MDRPRTVLAVWRPLPFLESNAWSLTLLGIAAVLLVLLWVFWRRRKREDKAERGDTSGPEEEPAATVETRGEPAPERKDDVDADFDELEL